MNKLIVNVVLQDNRVVPDGYILVGHDFDKVAITATVETNFESAKLNVRVSNLDLHNGELIEVVHQGTTLQHPYGPSIRFNALGEMEQEAYFATIFTEGDISTDVLRQISERIYMHISDKALRQIPESAYEKDESGCYWGRSSIASSVPTDDGYNVELYANERFGKSTYFAILHGSKCKTNGVQAVRMLDEAEYLEALRDATYFRKNNPHRAVILVKLFAALLNVEPANDHQWTYSDGVQVSELSRLPKLSCPICRREFECSDMVEEKFPDSEDEHGEVYGFIHICSCGEVLKIIND